MTIFKKLMNIFGQLLHGFVLICGVIFIILAFGPKLLTFIVTDYDINFWSIDDCIETGGVWLENWEKCDEDGSLQKAYCDSLSLEEYEEFRCNARLN